jgi:hypothetical protein
MKHLTVVIVSPSEIITDGLKTSLTKIKGNNLNIISISRQDDIERIFSLKPSLVIADPLMVTLDTVENLRQAGKTQIVALTAVNLPETVSHAYDTVMTLYEPTGRLAKIITEISTDDDHDNGHTELSSREREIVISIVKGMSNKEIADAINLSVNTVMTHRRNIARKLQIHSTAALTVYAIVRNLVKIEDIKTMLPTGI